MKRALAAFTVFAAAITLLLMVPPTANASPSVVWYVHYGSAVTGTSPNVWSNRNPTWIVGSDPFLSFLTNGDLTDNGLVTCGGVCWHSNTGNVGPGPWQAYWDSRAGANSGHFRIYSSDGAIRFDTNTGSMTDVAMVFFQNGCLNIYAGVGGNPPGGSRIWGNSYSSACDIYY